MIEEEIVFFIKIHKDDIFLYSLLDHVPFIMSRRKE